MDNRPHTRFRGIALLAVLGFIVIASSAVIASARIAATSGLAIRQHHDGLASTDLLNSLRSSCTQWIARQADTATAEAGIPYGGIPVLSDQIERIGQSMQIRITAYDQDTRFPLERLSELDASEFRGSLYIAEDNAVDLPELEFKLLREPEPIAIFPGRADQPALLGLARTPGLKSGSRTRSVSLNPRTVPDEIVRIIYGDSADQMLEDLNEWRSRADRIGSSGQGEFTTAESPMTGTASWTSQTQAWAFRIDLETEYRRTAFWAVYEAAPGTGWRLRIWHRIGDGSE